MVRVQTRNRAAAQSTDGVESDGHHQRNKGQQRSPLERPQIRLVAYHTASKPRGVLSTPRSRVDALAAGLGLVERSLMQVSAQ
ncbi:hypothetical protein CCMA1212_007209 [Trichoderma ghanense]|uniref:Uncharacterized protein n=1 Tax=Trichoderma ghanense TaxID=65468 RepID=A0ABY2GY74_9HYPO